MLFSTVKVPKIQKVKAVSFKDKAEKNYDKFSSFFCFEMTTNNKSLLKEPGQNFQKMNTPSAESDKYIVGC